MQLLDDQLDVLERHTGAWDTARQTGTLRADLEELAAAVLALVRQIQRSHEAQRTSAPYDPYAERRYASLYQRWLNVGRRTLDILDRARAAGGGIGTVWGADKLRAWCAQAEVLSLGDEPAAPTDAAELEGRGPSPEQLAQLVRTRRPPQQWYDEAGDPLGPGPS